MVQFSIETLGISASLLLTLESVETLFLFLLTWIGLFLTSS